MPKEKPKSNKHDVKAKSSVSKKPLSTAKNLPKREKAKIDQGVDSSEEDTLQIANLGRDEIEEKIIQQASQIIETRKKFKEEVKQHKRVTEAFNELNRNNELILKSAGEGIYGLDNEGNTTFINPAAAKMIGYSPEELIGKQQHSVLHHTKPDGSPYPREECPIYLAFKDGKVHHVLDEVFWRKDGSSFAVEYISTPIIDDGKILGAVVTFKDITERKKTELELKRSNAELEAFASTASHDLQEPLRKVITFGDRLKNKLSDLDPQAKNDLERMQNATERMQLFINDLLKYSRVSSQTSAFEKVDLNKLVEKVLEDLEVRISETKGTVNIVTLPTLEIDPFQIHQLFLNLVGNALKFHREGVSPVVTLDSFYDGNGNWQIKIEDNGIGFEEKYADRIFEPFKRLHGRDAYEGTGVGLAICRRIVNHHDGEITVQSCPEKGTKFLISLPEKQNK